MSETEQKVSIELTYADLTALECSLANYLWLARMKVAEMQEELRRTSQEYPEDNQELKKSVLKQFDASIKSTKRLSAMLGRAADEAGGEYE